MLRVFDVLFGQTAGEPWPVPWTLFGAVVALVVWAVRWLLIGMRQVGDDRRRDLEAERQRCHEEIESRNRRIAQLELELERLRKGEA